MTVNRVENSAMLRALICILFVVTGVSLVQAEDRGTIQLRFADTNASVMLYAKSYALVIGIDVYTNGWPPLANAVKDAKAVAEELGRRGFEVTLKTDLTRQSLVAALERFVLEKGSDPEARLLIWYAGHGHTINGEGYLVAADAPKAETGWQFRSRALSMRRFGEYMREARAKHVIAVFDSCFSGTIFSRARSAGSVEITRATTLPVRQFVTSGDATQEVRDDGRFRRLFLGALTGREPRADTNGDGLLTGSELGRFLSFEMSRLSRNQQTPRYGELEDDRYDDGDFIFQVRPNEHPDESGVTVDVDPEASEPKGVADLPPPVADYSKSGSYACFGGAEFPESWRYEAVCLHFGCNFGRLSRQACLALGERKGSKMVIHGNESGDRTGECWLQQACGDLRAHSDFSFFRRGD